jgi:LAO/AO transport system kinase
MQTDGRSDPRQPSGDRSELIDRAIGGQRRALARLISRVEANDAAGRELAELVYPRTGRAHRIGVTGPPGAGKSTLIARLIAAYRELGRRVGVVAVDPSSPMTGGATLGDRIRLMEFHADPDVFVRSMASRGHRGGLAATTASVAHVLDAAGFDPILVETLGVGQDEVDVGRLAHTVVVLQVPGLGDAVQTLKAGLLEIADVLVVNKADQPGADRLVRDLASMRSLSQDESDAGWRPPIVRTTAATGDGIGDLIRRIEEHRAHLAASGQLTERERAMAAAEVANLIRTEVEARLAGPTADATWTAVVAEVAGRTRSPASAAELLLATVGSTLNE